MSAISVGDMAQQFRSLRNTAAIKTDLAQLGESLSSGKVTDLTRTLNGQTAQFSALRYSLEQLDAYSGVAIGTQQTLSGIQSILAQVEGTRSMTADRLLRVNASSTIAQVDEAASSARSAFDTVVSALNTQLADRALLGGTDVVGPPLAAGDLMLGDIVTQIGAATDATAIVAVIDAWFDDPVGGFATLGYLGDTGAPLERRISENQSVAIDARADDPVIVEILKATAISAVANDLPAIDRETKVTLLETAGQRLFVASSDLVAVQARTGFAEARVEQILSESQAQMTALGMAQNDLVLADPFETATRLQAVQLQLETHFSVTARMSQLSLLRFI